MREAPSLVLEDDFLVMNPGSRRERRWPLEDVLSILPEVHPDLQATTRGINLVDAVFCRITLRSGRTLRIRAESLATARALTHAHRARARPATLAFEDRLVDRALRARTPSKADHARAERLARAARIGALGVAAGVVLLLVHAALVPDPVVRDLGRGLLAIGLLGALAGSLGGLAARWRAMRRDGWERTRELWAGIAQEHGGASP